MSASKKEERVVRLPFASEANVKRWRQSNRCFWFLALILAGSIGLTSCSSAHRLGASEEASDASFRAGTWAGGFGLLSGDRREWAHFSILLERHGTKVEGEGLYVFGKSRLSGKLVRLEGLLAGSRLSFTIAVGQDRPLECAGDSTSYTVVGSCVGGGKTLDFRMLRQEAISPDQQTAFEGVYELEDGPRIVIGKTGPMPTMVDLRSGLYRALFPLGSNTWGAGPRFAVNAPVELWVEFEKASDTGRADRIRIRQKDGSSRTAVRRQGLSREEFSFSSEHDGVALKGTLTLPQGPGPHPGIVFVHGSGPVDRSGAMFFPEYLADLGFATLAVDKRGVGESGGSYALPDGTSDNVPHMKRRAIDVISGVRALKKHPKVSTERVGLFGISQAGWVMPVSASSADISFTVTLGGGAAHLSREQLFSQLSGESSSDASLPDMEELLRRVRAAPATDYDWSRDFAAQKSPGLWIYGLNDRSNPSQLCVELLESVKERHRKDFTIVTFERGNHALQESELGGATERVILSRFVPFFAEIERWLEAKQLLP